MRGMLAMPASTSFIVDNIASRLEARPPKGREAAIELLLIVCRVETMNATFVDGEPLGRGHTRLLFGSQTLSM